MASPALGQLCGHARQRLRAEAYRSRLPFGPLKTPEPSLQLPAVALPHGLPSSGPLCGHARQRLRAEASLPFRDCRLAPSKPSNLLCSFQPSPCQLWPPQLWLASVASPALGQLCGHARQRLRAETSLPFRDCRLAPSKPSNLLCSFQPSPCHMASPALGHCVATPGSGFAQKLPYRSETAVWPPQNPRTFSAASSRRPATWPPQLWANSVATPGSGFAQKLPYRSETAVWPPQNPRTFSATSRTIHVSTVTCKSITGGLYQEFGTSRALMRFPSQTKKKGSAAPGR